jgi:hypothetical protein
MLKKMYCIVTEETFFRFLDEAKAEGLANKDGLVDIGVVLSGLVKAYGEGKVRVVSNKPVKAHATRFRYTGASQGGTKC